jgi:signal peptide peptidase SppA
MIMPASLHMILEILDAHLTGNITQEEIRLRMQSATPRQSEGRMSRNGAVAVLPLHGPIFPKANMMTEFSGATSLEEWVGELRQLVADESIGSIILDVDSPGGMSSMVAEAMAEVRAARAVKPVYAVAHTMAASAAYGIASQATKMFSTPSGIVGSVGTYFVHSEEFKRRQAQGITDTVIKSDRLKAYDIEPMTAESHAAFQEWITDMNSWFVGGIAEGRGIDVETVQQTYGEGKVFAADRAHSMGLIDGIATLEEVVGQAVEGGTPLAQSHPASKSSYDADKEHSEPGSGTGGEPTPREPPEEGDPAIEGGWRRDPPPVAYETEEAVNREWLEARATALGIEFTSEMADADLAQAVATRSDELVQVVAPLQEATQEAQQARDFARDYPEQAAEIASLRERDAAAAAHAYAEGFAEIGDTDRGYSTQMRGAIETAHQAIANRQFTVNDLTNLLTMAATNLVPRGERGSSRSPESTSTVPTGNVTEDRKAFAQLVKNAMTEDNMDQDAAIAHVSQQHPDLARAYAVGHTGR